MALTSPIVTGQKLCSALWSSVYRRQKSNLVKLGSSKTHGDPLSLELMSNYNATPIQAKFTLPEKYDYYGIETTNTNIGHAVGGASDGITLCRHPMTSTPLVFVTAHINADDASGTDLIGKVLAPSPSTVSINMPPLPTMEMWLEATLEDTRVRWRHSSTIGWLIWQNRQRLRKR